MKKSRFRKVITTQLSLITIGVGMGWLFGMSVSPVIHILIGTLVTLVGGLAGLQVPAISSEKCESSANTSRTARIAGSAKLGASAILVLGIVFGSAFGVFVRANDLLGRSPWLLEKRLGFELTNEQTFQILGERSLASASTSADGVLFGVSVAEMDELENKSGDDLISAFQTMSDDLLVDLASSLTTDEQRENLKAFICQPKP